MNNGTRSTLPGRLHHSGKARRALATGLILSMVAGSASLFADDTEVFFGQVDPAINEQPNVMFVLDTSGSMRAHDGTPTTRLERLKRAMYKVIDNSANVNIGLMRFNGTNSGGPVLFPVTPIDEESCLDADCGMVRIAARVDNGTDDVTEDISSGAVLITEDRIAVEELTTTDAQAIGLRFLEFDIPQGATISEARLEMTAFEDAFDVVTFSISADLSDDSAPFAGTAGEVSGRSYGPTANWFPGSWVEGEIYESPDLSSVIQAVTDRAGWCGGNSFVLKVQGSGQRGTVSSDFSLDDAPQLTVVYDSTTVPLGGGCTGNSEIASVSSNSDDARQDTGDGGMDLGKDSHQLGKKEKIWGLRFRDLNVPQGASITSAYLEFQIATEKTGSLTLEIAGEANDNAPTFTGSRWNISSRTSTVATESWINPPYADKGDKLTSPDLAPMVQEIVNRLGWSAGNAMVFTLLTVGDDEKREVESHDGDTSAAPKLVIEYTAGGGLITSTVMISARDRLKQIVADLRPQGGTPLIDAYYEAATYFTGGPVDYGTVRGYPGQRHNRISHPDSYTGGTIVRDPDCTDSDPDNRDCASERIDGAPVYISPITSSCQTNNIVLLTDGAATSNTSAAKIRTMTGVDTCEVNSSNEACGRSLATWLSETDSRPLLHGTQKIATYTVGFNLSTASSAQQLLQDIADNGAGVFHNADTADELADVFQSVLREVVAIDTSFVAPGATVSQFDRLTHRDDIYFAVFKPKQTPTWLGNLKRYKVGLTTDNELRVLDFNGEPAVDATTGFFADGAQSWWSTVPDGNAVNHGGAAEQLEFDGTGPYPARRVFTFTGDTAAIPAAGVNLTLAAHALSKSNSAITLDMLGVSTATGTPTEHAAERDALLDWASGIDLLDEDGDGLINDQRTHIGDPMHSRPVLIGYDGVTEDKSIVFMSTNEGFLHAVDSETGKEVYSFIPQELLTNLSDFMVNSNSTPHPYGLDGSASIWMDDVDGDLQVDPGDKAYIYIGMRRGGNRYYAIDVSDPLAPKLAWSIEGGSGGTTGFEELGQSWSRMVPARIAFEGAEREVLIFAGGYDENQDYNYTAPALVRTPDTSGRGLFVVDARTGALLWSGLGAIGGDQFFSEMEYGMPSDVRVIDIDFDGLADMLYIGDMGGQVWRFDLVDEHVSGDLVTGDVIADFSGIGAANERRFYYAPDVALIGEGAETFLSISMGSGWRAHPLDLVVNDSFYMLKDYDLHRVPTPYGKVDLLAPGGKSPVTEADLLDITNDLAPATNGYGWRMSLEADGEKVLGSSITINNQIVFTSFKPEVSIGDCSTAIGGGSVYVIDVLDGKPSIDLDEDGTLEKADREQQLTHGGIPPDPTALLTEHGPVILVGPEQPVAPNFGNLTRRSSWVELGAGY